LGPIVGRIGNKQLLAVVSPIVRRNYGTNELGLGAGTTAHFSLSDGTQKKSGLDTSNPASCGEN
jgi:hypothetical protein